MVNAPTVAYFKLKDALEYRFHNRVGQRILSLKRGQVLRVEDPVDISYFRARPDVLVETNPDGVDLHDVGLMGHYRPGKAKSFRVYGRAAKSEPTPASAQPVAPAAPSSGTQAVNFEDSPRVQAGSIPIGNPQAAATLPPTAPTSKTPGEMLSAPRQFDGDMSPIEEALPDGSTQTVRPRRDPGM